MDLLGGLGNNLFQIAAAYALALRHNDEFLLPQWRYSNYFGTMSTYDGRHIEYYYNQDGFNYDEPIIYKSNMSINGYFQSEKYFCDFKDKIAELLYPRCNKKFPFPDDVTCSIHVRRGDYCNYPHLFPLQPYHYYNFCVNNFKKIYGIKFLVFSDDINWCKNNFDNCFFVEGNNELEDFSWMTQCTHNIIANSTFSWWAAWLNKNLDKVVFAPKTWFVHLNNAKDLIPSSWICSEDYLPCHNKPDGSPIRHRILWM